METAGNSKSNYNSLTTKERAMEYEDIDDLEDKDHVCVLGRGTEGIAKVLAGIDYGDIEARVVNHITEEDMFNLSYAVNALKQMVSLVDPRTYRDKGGLVLDYKNRNSGRPIPKKVNARQAWKNRGKTRRK